MIFCKKTLLASSIALASLVTYAHASSPVSVAPVYIGVEGGVAFPSGQDFGSDLDTGYQMAALIGYHLSENWRTDLHFDRIQYLNYESRVKLNQYIVTVNAYYDLYNIAPQKILGCTPYFSAGLGWAHNTFSPRSNNFNGFAWEVGTGITYDFRIKYALSLGYRLLGNRHINNGMFETGYNNIVSLSLTYRFSQV